MATTVTFKLNKPAKEFAAGDSVGFNINGGVRYYDRESKSEQWTNYTAVVFAKQPAQVQFYQSALVEGAVVEVTGEKLKIRQFQGNNGLSLSIELLDAKLGFVYAPQAAQQQRPAPQQQAQQQQRQQPQQGFNQPRQAPPQGYQGQMPQQSYNQQPAPIDFEDDIPF